MEKIEGVRRVGMVGVEQGYRWWEKGGVDREKLKSGRSSVMEEKERRRRSSFFRFDIFSMIYCMQNNYKTVTV